MNGNVGLTQNVIHNEINVKQKNSLKTIIECETINCAKQEHKKYTEILPYKQVYEGIEYEENGIFHYNFVLKNNSNKLLILKELYLMSEDLTVDEFFPSIIKIVHMVKDKFALNEFDGLSLKAINLFLKYNNKYCLTIPIISSYSVMNRFENNPIVVNIETHTKTKFKLLGIFNNVTSSFEIDKFNHTMHEYLNTSFKLYKFITNINKSISVYNSSENVFYKSIILIVDYKFKNLEMSLKTSKFDTCINLCMPHKKIGDKIAFLITNSHNKHNENLIDYQPQGLIETNFIDIVLDIPKNCEIVVILQQYNIITLFT